MVNFHISMHLMDLTQVMLTNHTPCVVSSASTYCSTVSTTSVWTSWSSTSKPAVVKKKQWVVPPLTSSIERVKHKLLTNYTPCVVSSACTYCSTVSTTSVWISWSSTFMSPKSSVVKQTVNRESLAHRSNTHLP